MTETTRSTLDNLIGERQDAAYRRLQKNPKYVELCKKKEQLESKMKALYDSLDGMNQQTVEQYSDIKAYKELLMLDETYLQGLRDCFWLIQLLYGYETIYKKSPVEG